MKKKIFFVIIFSIFLTLTCFYIIVNYSMDSSSVNGTYVLYSYRKDAYLKDTLFISENEFSHHFIKGDSLIINDGRITFSIHDDTMCFFEYESFFPNQKAFENVCFDFSKMDFIFFNRFMFPGSRGEIYYIKID